MLKKELVSVNGVVIENSPFEYVGNRNKTFHLSYNFDCRCGQFDI